MVWVRLDDHFDENPKIAAVGPLGLALWTVGLAYCNRNLTDGFIPFNVANGLLSWEYLDPQDGTGRRKRWRVSVSSGMVGDDVSSERVIDLLVYAGLWEWDDERGGYYIHDYDHFQPSRASVEAERRSSAERTARSRAKSQPSNGASNTVTDGASNTVSTPAPVPVPVPTASKEAVDGAKAPRRPKAAIKEHKPMTNEQKLTLLKDFAHIPHLQEEIDFALTHESYQKSSDDYLYIRHWLRGWRGPTNAPRTEPIEFMKPRGVTVPDMGFRE